MSYLDQFPSQPRRPKDIPGNDGYVLYRQPGFAEEQQFLKVVFATTYTADYSASEPVPVTHRVNIDFPQIKLGANNYVIDLETLDVTATVPKASMSLFGLDPVAAVTVSGLGETYQVVEGGRPSVSNDMIIYMPGGALFQAKYDSQYMSNTNDYTKKIQRRVYQRQDASSRNCQEYGCPIPSDALSLSFTVTDECLCRQDWTNNTRLGSTTVTKKYGFVIRPNACKRQYFDH